jgi:hypothetical protein
MPAVAGKLCGIETKKEESREAGKLSYIYENSDASCGFIDVVVIRRRVDGRCR